MVALTRKTIDGLWKEIALYDHLKMRRATEGILAISRRLNRNARLPTLDAWLLVFDQFVFWYAALATILFASDPRRLPGERCDEWRACTSLLCAIVSNLLAIRQLVVSGFDVAAKQLTRSLCEYADLLNLIVLKPSLATDFINLEDQDERNKFWWKHVKKARKIVHDYLATLGEVGEYEAIDAWRQQEDTLLSMAAHPSFIASFAAAVPSEFRGLGYFGQRTTASNRTVHYAISALCDFLLVGLHVPFEHGRGVPPLLKFNRRDPLHQYVKNGRIVLSALVRYIDVNHDSIELDPRAPRTKKGALMIIRRTTKKMPSPDKVWEQLRTRVTRA